jgi:Asp-tRNA(Asn)/Glu-tRNA(Gln) amidotransferase A subunit family amidase
MHEPDWLRWPIEQRVRSVVAGELDRAAWSAEADAWAADADARYRGCAELRPAPTGAPPVRVGVKDLFDVAGFATRLGLRRYRHYPTRSAAALAPVPPAAVVAKLVTTELSLGMRHGCVNPRYPHLSPAGSSTGCAVAVGAGVCDLALGTDTVVSVRLPAAVCGLAGLRMTPRPALLQGIFQVSPLLDAVGWIARTAADLSYLWRFLRLDRLVPEPVPATPDRFRLGIVEEVQAVPAAPAVREAFEATCARLAAAGHTLVPVRLGELWQRRGDVYELCTRAAWDSYREWRDRLDDELDESTEHALRAGAAVTDARYAALRDDLAACRGRVPALFAAHGVDAWLLPHSPLLPRNRAVQAAPSSTIPRPDDEGYQLRIGYAGVASLAGLPAITVPMGHSAEHDAPIGLEAIGPANSEPWLLRLAELVSDVTGPVAGERPLVGSPA